MAKVVSTNYTCKLCEGVVLCFWSGAYKRDWKCMSARCSKKSSTRTSNPLPHWVRRYPARWLEYVESL